MSIRLWRVVREGERKRRGGEVLIFVLVDHAMPSCLQSRLISGIPKEVDISVGWG